MYPNPTNGELRIILPASESGDYHIKVVDLSGRPVLLDQIKDNSEHILDCSGISPGMYLLVVEGKYSYTERLHIR